MNQKPLFSIVIPTLNEEKYLPLLLKDLSNQSNKDFEVIHVDGQSDDKTVKAASEFAEKIDLTTISVKVRNVSFQRNTGIDAARGKWVIFMDADNRINRSFLDGITYRLAQNKSIDLFTTWVSIDEGKSINKPIERAINLGLEVSKLVGREWGFGALIGVKTKIAKESKFDEKQKVGEDGYFIKALVDKGHNFKIFRDPRYRYSLRRMETEGTLSYTRSAAKIAFNYLQGKDFHTEDFGYAMKGGSYYDNKNGFNFSKLPMYLKSLPKKQFDQAKKLFKNLIETEF